MGLMPQRWFEVLVGWCVGGVVASWLVCWCVGVLALCSWRGPAPGELVVWCVGVWWRASMNVCLPGRMPLVVWRVGGVVWGVVVWCGGGM